MRDMKIVQLIWREVERLDPALEGNETEDDYRTGVVLLAAVWVTGTDIDKLPPEVFEESEDTTIEPSSS
jgi:hypothetical protein